MRRADRLFRIVEFLKARRQAVTAQHLAEELEVSVRTIYRDITDLTLSGVPITGEAGVGYMLDKDYLVRPLMFELEEVEALLLGAQMVSTWGDKALSQAANSALDRMITALPTDRRNQMIEPFLFSLPSQAADPIVIDFTALRRSIRSKHKIRFHYVREDGATSSRTVRPLALAFFAPSWVLLGWCEARQDFRNFRVDRMQNLQIDSEHFVDERGKRLQDFKRQEAQKQKHKNKNEQKKAPH